MVNWYHQSSFNSFEKLKKCSINIFMINVYYVLPLKLH